jgi:hypothetical protein
MGKITWIVIGVVLFCRAAMIGAEDINGAIQQNTQSLQWLGLSLLILIALVVEVIWQLKKEK